MNGKEFCEKSYKYLISILPECISEEKLQKYFIGDGIKIESLNDIFQRLIISAQNYQMLPNVINYNSKKNEINKILFGLDYKKVLQNYDADNLCKTFQNKFNVIVQNPKRNLRLKWSKSIISSAKFINQFDSIGDFKNFVERFSYNEVTRAALPMLISHEISGYGFALSCDFIKELGYTEYCKPDIHMIDVFNGLGLCEKDDYDTFKYIVKIAKEGGITPYKLDKIIWLICSGRFYLDNVEEKSHKKEFIEYMRE